MVLLCYIFFAPTFSGSFWLQCEWAEQSEQPEPKLRSDVGKAGMGVEGSDNTQTSGLSSRDRAVSLFILI